jgi:hypothetical protein
MCSRSAPISGTGKQQDEKKKKKKKKEKKKSKTGFFRECQVRITDPPDNIRIWRYIMLTKGNTNMKSDFWHAGRPHYSVDINAFGSRSGLRRNKKTRRSSVFLSSRE